MINRSAAHRQQARKLVVAESLSELGVQHPAIPVVQLIYYAHRTHAVLIKNIQYPERLIRVLLADRVGKLVNLKVEIRRHHIYNVVARYSSLAVGFELCKLAYYAGHRALRALGKLGYRAVVYFADRLRGANFAYLRRKLRIGQRRAVDIDNALTLQRLSRVRVAFGNKHGCIVGRVDIRLKGFLILVGKLLKNRKNYSMLLPKTAKQSVLHPDRL